MASPTRRGFLTMAAGLMAQPKGALRAAKEEIPASIKKLLPGPKHPGLAWYTEGGLDDDIDRILMEVLENPIRHTHEITKDWKVHPLDAWMGSMRHENASEVDKFDKVYGWLDDLLHKKDLKAYKKLREKGLSQDEIQLMLKDMDTEARQWAQIMKEEGVNPLHRGYEDPDFYKGKDMTPPWGRSFPSLTNIGGYLARAGYEPGQGTAVHPDMTIPFDMNRIVNDNIRPLPAPSRANPMMELNLDDLPDKVER